MEKIGLSHEVWGCLNKLKKNNNKINSLKSTTYRP
jgi:hypothetical protein